jgi:hypothetical protein
MYCPSVLVIESSLIDLVSLLHGLLEISSMLKHIPSVNTRGKTCQ